MRKRSLATAGVAIAAIALVGPMLSGASASAAVTPPPGSVYSSLPSYRLLDTRPGGIGSTPCGCIGTNASKKIQVTGVDNVPIGATAVVLNVTATGTAGNTQTSGPGFLSVNQDSTVGPGNGSAVNFVTGQTVSNLVIANLGTDGAVDVYNKNAPVGVVVDLEGYYVPGHSSITSIDHIAPSSSAVTLTHVGGPIADGITSLGSVDLKAGTYNATALATFFRTAGTSASVAPNTYGTMVLWADLAGTKRYDYTKDNLGTIGGVMIPKMSTTTGDIDPTANLAVTFTLASDMTVNLGVFAYNDDRSSSGTGDFSAAVQQATFEQINTG